MAAKKELLEKFNAAAKNGDKYIGVKVSLVNAPEPEIIINPSTNFGAKIEYYEKAYDDNLCLIHCRDIRIVKCASGNTVAAVARELGEK